MRAQRLLSFLAVDSLDALCRYTRDEVAACPGAGKATLAELERALKRRKLTFSPPPPQWGRLGPLSAPERLKLRPFVREWLSGLGIETIAELLVLHPNHLARRRGGGAKVVAEIERRLAYYGLSLHPRGYGVTAEEDAAAPERRRRGARRLLEETRNLDEAYRVLLGVYPHKAAEKLAAWVWSGRPRLTATRRRSAQLVLRGREEPSSRAAMMILRELGAVELDNFLEILRERRLLRAPWPGEALVRFLRLEGTLRWRVYAGRRGRYLVAYGADALARALDRLR